jgi:hypothetical protein
MSRKIDQYPVERRNSIVGTSVAADRTEAVNALVAKRVVVGQHTRASASGKVALISQHYAGRRVRQPSAADTKLNQARSRFLLKTATDRNPHYPDMREQPTSRNTGPMLEGYGLGFWSGAGEFSTPAQERVGAHYSPATVAMERVMARRDELRRAKGGIVKSPEPSHHVSDIIPYGVNATRATEVALDRLRGGGLHPKAAFNSQLAVSAVTKSRWQRGMTAAANKQPKLDY